MKQLCKDICLAARAGCVLVATLIGAGYATGREVSQYFGQAHWATIVLSAVLMGLLSALFMYVGRVAPEPKGKWNTAYRWVLSVAGAVSCGVMISAGKTLLGGAWTGILLGLAGLILALQSKVFHIANLVAVPILLGLVVAAYLGAQRYGGGSAFLPLSAANYAGMNLLFEGELLRQEGKDMSGRSIVLAGVGISVCMAALLLLMHRMVGASDAQLPFAEVCAMQGKTAVVQGVILASILTNIAGCMRLTLDTWRSVAPMSIAALAALLTAMWVATASFADLVRYVYPVMGWMGVAVAAGYTFWAIRLYGKRRKRCLTMPKIQTSQRRTTRWNNRMGSREDIANNKTIALQ